MNAPQNRMDASRRNPALTPEEWSLIMEALSAYQHHSAFLAVYEKVSGLRLAQDGASRAGLRVPAT